MLDNVEEYTKICLTCQQDKIERQKMSGLLEPSAFQSKLWESISLDFLNNLSKIGVLTSIFVVVYRFSKDAMFILALK